MRDHINAIECAMIVKRSTETLAAWRKKKIGPIWFKGQGGRVVYVLESAKKFAEMVNPDWDDYSRDRPEMEKADAENIRRWDRNGARL